MKYFLPLLVIACSVIGSLANVFISSDSWYVDLVKSPLNPPSFVFGIVWPILYALMAFVSFKSADKIWKLFIPQLILNAAWSWMFFFMHAPLLALINITILIFLNQKILVILKIESKLLFWLYLPYVLWLSFAAFLNASIVFLN
ncbi:tryptophan-rich sensory protein [Gammaproteobacteria bacterium]|nr:tryptophan-rich sensory protein [Gammaproteobacteria bacterium]MDA9079584.1 tryptophan-rich sensory protein [Gammaproteobacteria bacterium]MDB4006844.1 tryptophan-rich sensory protein [Gammaproteobacteria bacterium]MDB9897011.1 tryptophan-rich sensory protein [Gammaproteobacteria bacterium]|tara:strand:- start:261 stop:692 length:432 start_codon:yes stop_codon:yes gene_type:complete